MERTVANTTRRRPGLRTLVAMLGLYLALALGQALGSLGADERRPLEADAAFETVSAARS